MFSWCVVLHRVMQGKVQQHPPPLAFLLASVALKPPDLWLFPPTPSTINRSLTPLAMAIKLCVVCVCVCVCVCVKEREGSVRLG